MNALLLAALTSLTAVSQPTDEQRVDEQPLNPAERSDSSRVPFAISQPQGDGARVDEPRLRLGIGLYGNGGTDILGLGLSVQIGEQLSDAWAVYLLLQGSTAVFINFGSASVIVERTFFDLLSVGTGVGAMAGEQSCISFGEGGGCGSQTRAGVQIPLRVALNLGPTPSTEHRHRFFIALDAGIGAMSGSPARDNGLTWNAGVSLGYVMM